MKIKTLHAECIFSSPDNVTNARTFEGPIWIDNALYFSSFASEPDFSSRIQKVTATGIVTVIDDSGSNGLALDREGNIIAASHKFKGLTCFNLLTGERKILVNEYNERVFNSPNDLVVARDQSIYFTDPDFQKAAAPGGQDKTAVYRVHPNGDLSVIDDTIANPNGIALSPSNDFLYVSGGGENGFIRRYNLANGSQMEHVDVIKGLNVPDGIAVDENGNLYVAEHMAQRIKVFTPTGRNICSISTNAKVTNVTFGGSENSLLYITGINSLWRLPLEKLFLD